MNSGSELAFYDWSANLHGPAQTLNRFSDDHDPGAAANELRELRQRWIESGRRPSAGFNRALIAEGAEPTRALAVQIAESVQDSGEAPQGAIVISEQALDSNGESVPGADNRGFFVINDDPALDESEILRPTAGADLEGEPVVMFEFTKVGETAFGALTRRIAARGRAASLGRAVRCSPDCVDNFSDSFAIVFRGRILERPIVNFLENPDGIDGGTGFAIQGGLTKPQARSVAGALSD